MMGRIMTLNPYQVLWSREQLGDSEHRPLASDRQVCTWIQLISCIIMGGQVTQQLKVCFFFSNIGIPVEFILLDLVLIGIGQAFNKF